MSISLNRSILLLALLSVISADTIEPIILRQFGIVDVTLSYTTAGSAGSQKASMFISLSTNVTGIALDTDVATNQWTPYDCTVSVGACNRNTANNFPLLQATDVFFTNGNQATSPSVGISSNLWTLESAPVVLFTRGRSHRLWGSNGVSGFIGLGAIDDARANFQSATPYFSLSISETAGQIAFGYDASLTNQNIPPVVLPSNANWIVPLSSISFSGNTYNTPLNLVFSPAAEGALYIPQGLDYTSLLTLPGVSRATDGTLSFTGNLNTLPSFTITTTNGSRFDITSDIYTIPVSNTPNTYIISINDQSKLWLDPDQAQTASNYRVVLGWHALRHIHPLFENQIGVPVIRIYRLKDSTYTADTSVPTSTAAGGGISGIAIALIVIVVVLTASVIGYLMYMRKKKAEIEEAFKPSEVSAMRI